MLTKEQKLAVLSKAIDEGANIDINFHGLTRSNAALLTKEIAGMLGTPIETKNKAHAYWYKTHCPGLDVHAFYDHKYMVEDVVRTIEEELV